jgi:hypothetical protein
VCWGRFFRLGRFFQAMAAKKSYDLGSRRTSRQKRLLKLFVTADHDAKQHNDQPEDSLRGAISAHYVSGQASLEEKLIPGTDGKPLSVKAGGRRLMVCGHFDFSLLANSTRTPISAWTCTAVLARAVT